MVFLFVRFVFDLVSSLRMSSCGCGHWQLHCGTKGQQEYRGKTQLKVNVKLLLHAINIIKQKAEVTLSEKTL